MLIIYMDFATSFKLTSDKGEFEFSSYDVQPVLLNRSTRKQRLCQDKPAAYDTKEACVKYLPSLPIGEKDRMRTSE